MMDYDEYSHGQLVSRINSLEIELAKATLTLRDEFAKAAMPAIYTEICRECDMSGWPEGWKEGVAEQAYQMADFMLEARK